MRSRTRRLFLLASLAGVLACTVAASATPAFGYGKANWQATLNGTFVKPGGGGEGFWGWCAFAGSNDSGATGNDADCELAEYYRDPATNTNWTCHLSIDGTNWTSLGPGDFSPTSFHMDGSLTINGQQHLTQAEQDACVGFFYTGDPNSPSSDRSFTNVDTFIPGAPGHYNLGFLVPIFFPGDVGELNFTVKQIP
jgi:hypothetical protein